MRNVIRVTAIGLGALVLLGGCVVNAPPVAETTVDGLERVQAKQVDTLYMSRGMSLAPYKRVMLDSVEFAFKADWQQRHPEVTAADLTRIRSQGAGVFYEIFSAALSRQHGYPLTTQAGPDVLRITATISELDLAVTPGTAGTNRMHVVSPADLTLLMELRDSQSGALLVRAVDKEKGRTFGNLTVEDAVSNSEEARRALQMWADLLRAALDNARGTPQAP
jgi:hypothetical protein